MSAQNGYFESGDGSLYYEIAGEGIPVVLSHAAFLDSRMFDAQWEVLAEHFRVVRYDMLGYGKSSDATGPVCRRDNLRALLRHLGIEQAHLVGCSMGGEIVLDLALEEPSLALSLALVGAAPSGWAPEGEPPRYVMEMIQASMQGDFACASELQLRIWIDGPTREPDEVDAGLRARASEMNRPFVERGTFAIADMQPLRPLDPPAVGRLAEVTCPALVVAGALEDPAVLTAADLLTAGIAGAHKAIVEGAAHVPSFERPDLFTPLLLDFLNSPR